MQFLRQNTAVIVTVGPFYDKTDGVTIETALTITNERITLTADTDDGSAPTNILDNITGATSGTSNDLNYISGNDAGLMQIELSAANTNRVGRMKISITDAANHVPVFDDFFVMPQAIYDWFTGVIVPLPANMTQILGTAVSTPATAGILDVNVKNIDNDAASASGTVTFPNATLASTTNITAATGVDTTKWTGGTIPAPNVTGVPLVDDKYLLGTIYATPATAGLMDINLKQISTDGVAADNAEAFFDGTGYAGTGNTIPTVTTLTNLSAAAVQAIWDALTSALTTVGSIGKLLVDNINATISSRATQTSVDTIDDFVDTEIADIQARLPAALVSGRMDASVGAMAANVLTASAIATDAITAAKIAADAIGASELAADAVTEIQSGLSTLNAAAVNAEVVDALTVDIVADSIPTDGTRPTIAQALLMMTRFLWEKAVSGTTVTVKKEDGTTTSFTATLDSATDPTSITRAT